MKLIYLPVIAILLVTFAVTGEKLIAQYHPKIDVVKDIDVCDSTAKTRLMFRVNIGPVKKSDSLYGFDLEIRYNPEKIKIINYYTGNTLSEFFEEKSFSFGLNVLEDEGIIRGYATTFKFSNPPSYGDSILVVFGAEWLGTCEDTTRLEMFDLNFTQEFKKVLSDTFDVGVVKAYPFENANRYASIVPVESKIDLKDNENNFNLKYKVNLPNKYYTDNILLKLLNTGVIKIQNAVSSNENVEVLLENNDIALRLKNGVSTFDLDLNCNYTLKDTITDLKFYLESMKLSDCSCILGMGTDTVLVSKDSTYVGIKESRNAPLSYENEEIIINNDNFEIDKVIVADLLGRTLSEINTDNEAEIKIFTKDFETSVFFVIINKKTKFEIKKFYKCY